MSPCSSAPLEGTLPIGPGPTSWQLALNLQPNPTMSLSNMWKKKQIRIPLLNMWNFMKLCIQFCININLCLPHFHMHHTTDGTVFFKFLRFFKLFHVSIRMN